MLIVVVVIIIIVVPFVVRLFFHFAVQDEPDLCIDNAREFFNGLTRLTCSLPVVVELFVLVGVVRIISLAAAVVGHAASTVNVADTTRRLLFPLSGCLM